MLGFPGAPIGAAYHIVFALAQFLAPVSGGLATAAAIVVFTAAVRLLLSPLSVLAYRGQARISRLQPMIAELRRKHAHQPDRLQEELTALYRAEGGGMLAGCLPLLVQLPFFSVMYRLFLSKTVAGHPNALLARDFITTPLGSHLLAGAGLIGIHGLVFLGLFAVLAGVTFLATRAAKSAAVAAALAAGTVAAGTVTAGTAAAGQPGLGWLGQVLPYTTLIIAAFVPLAAVLYLVTTTSWTAAERAVLRRWHRGAGQVASPG
ncbi:MAG TPA: membrane protein insertase YidC [Streptosporangiaceae bacterium]|nr:membrane protein insertase YidC [Streptosporangiaceae bacterium]